MSYISQKTGLQVDALLDKIDALVEATSSQSGLMSSSDKMKLDDMEGVSASEKATWNAKQDAIADLAAIRSGASAGSSAYQKPSGGIPKGDLASAVQTSLGKADTALQSFTETDPTVPSWAKASNKPSYTAAEVDAVPTSRTINGKALNADITLSASDVSALPSSTVIPAAQIQSDWNQSTTTALDYIKNKPTIPTVPTNVSAFTNDMGYLTSHQDISGKEDRVSVGTISGTSLSASLGIYYVGSSVGTLAVTLPTVSDATHIASVVLNMAMGTSPSVTFTAASGVAISYSKDFALEASKEYEVNCLWQGTKWIIMAVEVKTPSS